MNKVRQKYKSLPVQTRASMWFLVCSFLQAGVSVITTPIYTRLLNTTEYGDYSVFVSWMRIITVVVSLQLYFGVYVQGIVKFDEDKKVFTSSLQGLTLTLVSGFTILYVITRSFWNGLLGLSTPQMLAMMSMIWTTAVFNFWASWQRNEYEYKKLVILTVVVTFLKPVVSIIAIELSHDKVTAWILALMVVEWGCYIGLFVQQMVQGKVFFSKKYWLYALKFNIPLIPHYLSEIVMNSSDRIMIKMMVGAGMAGIYSLAYSLSHVMILFNNALIQTIAPWIYQKIRDKKTEDIAPIAYASLICVAAVNVVLMAFAPEAVMIFAPKEYYDAIWIIPPVAMSVYFIFSYSLFSEFEFYYEKTQYITIATSVNAVLNIILNYIFIGKFGYYAAGYTTLLCYFLYATFHYLFMRKICMDEMDDVQPYDTKIILKITGIFMLFGMVFLISYFNTIIRYSLILVLAVGGFIMRKRIVSTARMFIDMRKPKYNETN